MELNRIDIRFPENDTCSLLSSMILSRGVCDAIDRSRFGQIQERATEMIASSYALKSSYRSVM